MRLFVSRSVLFRAQARLMARFFLAMALLSVLFLATLAARLLLGW